MEILKMIRRPFFDHILSSLLLVVLPGLVVSPVLIADQIEVISQIQKLDDEFKSLSSGFYASTLSATSVDLVAVEDIDQLLDQVNNLAANQQSIAAIRLLNFNIATIRNNLDSPAVFTLTDFLLIHNEWRLAKALFDEIKDEGDKSLLASMQYIFAKYHARRNEWSEVNRLLEGTFTELSPDKAEHAYLLNGSALQYLKKHRLAVESHSKIPVESKYYSYARLNMAIASIRQGWLTEARTTLTSLIADSQQQGDDDLTNRLYLVLGYALLQTEYYRDARNAFRNIALDSRYANRALLGIGLTATSQGDFVGGLNALTILKGKQTFDLPVDESYLLIPFLYEKLQQGTTATASYTEAIDYYQSRLIQLNNLSNLRPEFARVKYADDISSLIIRNNSLDYGEMFPASFIHNYRELSEFSVFNQNSALAKKIEKLIFKFDAVFQSIVAELINRRKKYLSSYLNQSQYGLARLYDSSREAAN